MDEQRESKPRSRNGRGATPPGLMNLLFWCLVVAAIILVVVLIITASKLGKANKELSKEPGTTLTSAQQTDYETRIAQLNTSLANANKEISQLKSDLAAAQSAGTATTPSDTTTPSTTPSDTTTTPSGGSTTTTTPTSSWLDLTPYTKLQIKPKADEMFTGYVQKYIKATELNVRAGPGTAYDKLATVKQNDKVSTAAANDEWTLISYGTGFGWVKTEFLSNTTVTPTPSTTPSTPTTVEGTGGNLAA